jgi:hypothetical protein
MGSIEPTCTRCGHPRSEHPAGRACVTSVRLETGFALGRCACSGYTSNAAALWEPVGVARELEDAPEPPVSDFL